MFSDMWRWTTILSTTYLGGPLHTIFLLCDTAVRASVSMVGIILFNRWSLLSERDFIDGYVLTFPLIVIIWLFTCMKVNGSFVRDNSSLYCMRVFLSFAISKSGVPFTWTFYSTVKVGKVQNGMSKYRLYKDSCFDKVCEAFFWLTATWCSTFWRKTFSFVALTVSSGSIDVLTTVVDPEGCLDSVRLDAAWSVELCTWELCPQVNSYKNMV